MPTSTLTSKGQTTIPKQVREHLRIESGDRLDFVIEPDGRVTLRPATADLRQLDGLLDRSGTEPRSIEAMDAAVEKAASAQLRPSS